VAGLVAGALGLAVGGWAATGAEFPVAILKAKPAVVQVLVSVTPTVRTACAPGQPEREVTLDPDVESGTGFLVHPNGYFVTNAHVVKGYQEGLTKEDEEEYLRQAVEQLCGGPKGGRAADLVGKVARFSNVEVRKDLTVILSNGKRLPGEVKQYSPPMSSEASAIAASGARGVERSGKDIAVVKIEGTNLPTVALGDSDTVQLGQQLHIISIPVAVLDHRLLSRQSAGEPSVTSGRVSGRKQDARGVPVIQTDAAVSWGSSGSPAIDSAGGVIGVTTFITVGGAGKSQAIQGFNFLVPINTAREFLRAEQVKLDQESPFTKEWAAGLEAFARGDYVTAVAAIEGANRIYPDAVDVKRLLTDVQLRYAALPWWRKSAAARGAMGAAVVLVVGGAGGFAGLKLYSRARIRKLRDQGLLLPVDEFEARRRRGGLQVLDVRRPMQYVTSRYQVPGAVRMLPAEIPERSDELEEEGSVVVYCS
jgi:S1-C subfamily serine protease